MQRIPLTARYIFEKFFLPLFHISRKGDAFNHTFDQCRSRRMYHRQHAICGTRGNMQFAVPEATCNLGNKRQHAICGTRANMQFGEQEATCNLGCKRQHAIWGTRGNMQFGEQEATCNLGYQRQHAIWGTRGNMQFGLLWQYPLCACVLHSILINVSFYYLLLLLVLFYYIITVSMLYNPELFLS